MIAHNSCKNQLTITIQNPKVSDIQNYHRSLLKVLEKIEIGNCDPEFKEHLKIVYELLSHLQPDEKLLMQDGELIQGAHNEIQN